MTDTIQELTTSLKEVTRLFKSCIADGNGELEGDREAIARAEALIKKHERPVTTSKTKGFRLPRLACLPHPFRCVAALFNLFN